MSAQDSSYEKPGASTLKMGVKIFGYAILAGIMSVMLSFSIAMISNGLFTDTIGFHEYENVNGEKVLLETVYYDEDTTYESEKETATDDREIVREMIVVPRNSLCAAMIVVVDVVEQLLMLSILYVLCGYYVYREGDRDRNLVKHHGREATPLRGLWIGLLAWAPSLVPFILLVLGKCGVYSESAQGLYRLLNPCFAPLTAVIMPLEQYPAVTVEVWQLIVLFLLPLTTVGVCALCYQLGYKRVFKKKKKKKTA